MSSASDIGRCRFQESPRHQLSNRPACVGCAQPACEGDLTSRLGPIEKTEHDSRAIGACLDECNRPQVVEPNLNHGTAKVTGRHKPHPPLAQAPMLLGPDGTPPKRDYMKREARCWRYSSIFIEGPIDWTSRSKSPFVNVFSFARTAAAVANSSPSVLRRSKL